MLPLLLPLWLVIIGIMAILAAGCVVGFFLGESHRKKVAEAKIGSAEEEARRLVNDAVKTAQQKRKEALVEAKDAALQMKTEADKEIKERRNELSRQERRLDQKEEALDKKVSVMEQKEEDLRKRQELAEAKLNEVEQLRLREMEKLETIAGLSSEDAKQLLLSKLDEQLAHEKAMHIAAYETQTKDEAETMARELISQAIARCAADHSSEATVSVVALPSDEMKGRIIGREGRNIRALETATGVDLIIDDTPEAITLSSFDPVRREIARMTLERLISDGRIHPARIEETVDKCRRELELAMKREGEKAVMDVGLHGLHPDIVKLLGRLHYRTSYGQNVLQHSIEVSHIAGMMAAELGADVQTAKRAGLLHDIGKAVDHEMEGTHVSLGVEFCRKYREKEDVLHAIQAHHGDVECKTLVACLVQAADAISAARPGARRENLENYIKRLEKLEEITSSYPGVEKSYAIQAGREVRVMVKPEQVSEDQMVILARELAHRIENELEYPGQIKVHVLRETKAVEYAK